MPNCDHEKYVRVFGTVTMKKATAVCCVMILLFLTTLMNVDGLVPHLRRSISDAGRRKRVNDGYFEGESTKGKAEKREEMRRNICEFARSLDCDQELMDE